MSRVQLAVGAPLALAVSRTRFARLRRARARPFGLIAEPPVVPEMLSSDGWVPGLTDIVLSYGRPLAVSGPFIEVATCFSERHVYPPSLEEAIARAEYRDGAWARDDWVGGAGVRTGAGG